MWGPGQKNTLRDMAFFVIFISSAAKFGQGDKKKTISKLRNKNKTYHG